MKRKILHVWMMLWVGCISWIVQAQVDPGTANLKHQWTFDDGTATDHIGNVTGTIIGNAKLVNKGFNTTTNGYMSFPAAEIGINSYPEITTEIWCTSDAGKNTGWTMLSYFGGSTGGNGNNCTFVSIARAVDGSMVALETAGFWDGVSGPEYDDGRLHHFVSTINAQTVKFYIDGALIAVDTITAGNSIANISPTLALLGKGGWTADPNWLGIFHKYSLYDKALSEQEVLYLYQQGAESQAVISATITSLALDTDYPAEMFNVTSANLTGPLSVQAPAGIMVEPSAIPANQNDVPVAIIWDTATPVDGEIVLSSGATEVKIPVKTVNTNGCYTPLYANLENIVLDPGVNNLANFSGWGEKSIVSVITDPDNVYCGANSAVVGDGVLVGSGSINVDFTAMIQPLTTYRIRAMVKTVDGTFQLGVLGYERNQPDINHVIDTKGEWMPIDFTFSTGADMGDVSVMFFNNWQCTGTRAYIDNWEMFEYPEPTLLTNVKEIAMDPEYKTVRLIINASSLSEAITVSAPSGITLSKTTLTPNDEGKVVADTIMVAWDGAVALEGNLSLVTGSSITNIPLKTIVSSNTGCFVPLYTDRQNMVTDPYLNDPAAFSGWGARRFISVVSAPDSVLCGSHTGVVDGSGSMDVMLTGKMQPGTQYMARVQVRTFGGYFQLGVWGMNPRIAGDIQDSIDTQETWAQATLTFVTGDSLAAVQGMFVNNYQRTGKKAYIDNWELYNLGPVGISAPLFSNDKFYVSNHRIVADIYLEKASTVRVDVYSVQGALLGTEIFNGEAGRNVRPVRLPVGKGVYIVKPSTHGKAFKVISD